MPDASQITAYARLLRLTPVDAVELAPHPFETPAASAVGKVRRRSFDGLLSFLLLVALPACAAIFYFWGLAADRYESESKFVLRTPGRIAMPSGVDGLVRDSGMARANDDGFIVRDFLESRDAMTLLERKADLRGAVSRASGDPIWRYPAFFKADNQERLYQHYLRLVSATFDSGTGINTLKFEAFTPNDSRRLAATLIEGAEALVNRLNERARQDAISFAQGEVNKMQERVQAAQAALTNFRERERLVDPSQATMAVLEAIGRLSIDAANLGIQINELTASSPKAPQIATLRNRQGATEAQIAKERRRLAGDAQSIAPRIAEYERLMLEREFSERALIAAMTEVEAARATAQRQQIYLERVSEPNLPDYPAYPLRIVWTLAVMAAGYMAFRMWRILSKDTRQHRNA